MVKDRIHVEFEMEQQLSSRTKKSGQEYYELKFQLRFEFFKDTDYIKKKLYKAVVDNFEGINDIKEVKGGFDFFFRDVKTLNKISKYFNGKYLCYEKRSKKIVGRDHLKSKDLWRHTLLITILNIEKGDTVFLKGEYYRVKGINKKDIVLTHKEKGHKKIVSYDIVKDYLFLTCKYYEE